MRLNRDRPKQTNKIIPKRQSKHLNLNSMDNISSDPKTKSIYLNRIIQKNFGNNNNKYPAKDNIQTFKSSIQNIFSNEEKRLKAKNYVVGLRNRNNPQSPFQIDENYYSRNNKRKDIFYGTNYNRFYNKNDNLRRTYEILNENINRDNNNNIYYRATQNVAQINEPKIYGNSNENNTGFIKVNLINRFKDDKLNNNYLNSDIETSNPLYIESQSDININNSGYNEMPNDYKNEYPESPNNDNKLHYGGFKYNVGKSPIYYNSKYSYLNKVKTSNNFYSNLNKVYGKHSYSKLNYKSERKDKISDNKKFNNLKIAKNWFDLEAQKITIPNNNIKSSFNDIACSSNNNFSIKGNNNKKYLSKKDNEKIIADLQTVIKNQKKELDSKIKELSKYKNNNNNLNQAENK